ncbi:Hsp70 family protein [Mycobacterium malmoense]|uniref:Hsp70 family protein n=1 Tax=Mycobacterium malmoense TaxID=1780 RepID=UPI0008F8DCF3|nr:Hsp70 family protein [Mycobacterium malmoense]OIN82776.1 molecular chaperone [Mycobacterium malmoense]
MSESLGLSIGAANLVAAHIGGVPVTRSSVLTLFEHRPTEVGLPEENPSLAEAGLVLRGFVERVGDPAPLVAADGTKYLGEVLTVEAIEAMARTVGYGTPVTVAVPAYWSQAQSTALREEFFAQTDLTRSGVAPVLVSDATAALATLRAKPGFPADGVVALCDFGASGTSVTLTSAGSQQIGPSVRYADFSGDAIDQLILGHVRASDVANTTRIGAQNRLLGECRRAKEQLSTTTLTTLATGSGEDVRLSRSEFEQLVSAPLDRFLGALEEVLQRNGVRRSNLAAVAIVGGGANIPLITTRLSGRLQVPVHTTPQPATSAAIGAAMLGQQQASAGVPTTASPMVENPTELVGTARVIDGDGAVAWSQDADGGDEPVPYTGRDATGEYTREAKDFDYSDGGRADEGPLPWYKRTALVLSVAGACAAVLVAAVLALTLGHTKTNPINITPPNQPAPPQTSETTTGPNNSPTETVIPAPPPPATQPPATTTTNPPPTTTTSPPPPTTTTTTAEPTTTSQATTTEPPATTRERPLPPRFEPPFRR